MTLSLCLLFLLLSACGTESPDTPPPAISVMLTPASADVHAGQTLQFTATVRNSTNTAVTWSLSGEGCIGAACGTITDSGLFEAPASVPSPPTVTVKATAAADTSKSASAVVSILAPEIVVTLSPGCANVYFGGTLQFTAHVYYATDDTVLWSLSGDGCSGTTCGTISDSGLYTAPGGIPVPPTVTIKATEYMVANQQHIHRRADDDRNNVREIDRQPAQHETREDCVVDDESHGYGGKIADHHARR